MDSLTDEDSTTTSVNVTPLIDVSLVLVLVFLVTTPLSIIQGITVKRDTLNKYGLSTPQDNVMIHLETKAVYIADAKGTEKQVAFDDFGTVLQLMIQKSKSKNVYLQADRDVPHGATVWVLDTAKQNGAADIALLESKAK